MLHGSRANTINLIEDTRSVHPLIRASLISIKLFFVLLSLALFMAVVTAQVPNGHFSEKASEHIINKASYERVVNSSEIIEKIRMNLPVIYDDVIIRGDLNLSDLGLPIIHVDRTLINIVSGLSENATKINSLIRINNSLIEGITNFNNCFFNYSITFKNTLFKERFTIEGSLFARVVNFQDSEFSNRVLFRDAWFKKEICFNNVIFADRTDFSGSQFDGDTAFVDANFKNTTTFLDSKFNGDAHFDSCQFSRDTIFSSSAFGISCFNKFSDFSRSVFNESAQFNNIVFANTVDFRDTIFYGSLNLESSLFTSDVLFQNATFMGEINLKRTRWTKLFVRFDSIKDSIAYDPTAYQLLIKDFNDLGYTDDANNCYFQFMKQQLKHRNPMDNPLSFLFDLSAYVFYGYGIKVTYPIFWSLLSVVIFGDYWRRNGVEDPFRFSATLFISGTKFFVEPPDREIKYKGFWLMDMFRIEKILGTIFSVLLFLTLSRLILK